MVRWISHRGYCKQATENTLQAFAAAVAIGYRMLECDLRISTDGVLFLAHDPSLRRLCGDNRLAEDLSSAELKKIRLPYDGRITFFDEFFATYRHLDLVLDIKPENAARTISALQEFLVKNNADLSRITFLVWRRKHEHLLKEKIPAQHIFAREYQCRRAAVFLFLGMPFFAKVEKGKAYALPPRSGKINLYTQRLVNRYHQCGGKVISFLPETVEEARSALLCGVDFVISNHEIVLAP